MRFRCARRGSEPAMTARRTGGDSERKVEGVAMQEILERAGSHKQLRSICTDLICSPGMVGTRLSPCVRRFDGRKAEEEKE